MNGILCIDKPEGFTSFDVVAKMRGIAKTRKIGHGGTLDPMATGVLPLFLGGATKACDRLPEQDKRYTATFRLGMVTDTLDRTGKVLEQRPVNATAKEVEAAALSFLGTSMQLPPMYSAVQVNGVRLYDLARQGKEVERTSREITIHDIKFWPENEGLGEYSIDVFCAKGTYIRSLCYDIGKQLGCGATMTALRRTLSCGFSLQQCITLEQAQELAGQGTLARQLLPVEHAFTAFPRLDLDDRQARLLQNGVRMDVDREPFSLEKGRTYTAYGPKNSFLGLVKEAEGKLIVEKLFVREAIQ